MSSLQSWWRGLKSRVGVAGLKWPHCPHPLSCAGDLEAESPKPWLRPASASSWALGMLQDEARQEQRASAQQGEASGWGGW